MSVKIIKSILIIFGFSILSCTGLFAQSKSYKVIKYTAPIYPPAARAIRATGDVTVNVIIDKDGKVASSKMETGHLLLKQACEEAAKEWKFKADKNSKQREAKIIFSFSWAEGKESSIKFKKPYRLEVRTALPMIQTSINIDNF